MPKQLNVNLAFTADTNKAKAQLKELQQSLQDIAKLPGKANSLFDDTDLKNASKAALELQQHLNAAVNVNTGKLDLSRLSTSLKAANKDLNSYYNKLAKIGPEGQEAFLKLARSISTAEAPVTKINAKLAEMGTSLKNTARWQLSSSIIHGFMGTIQGAYGYAQDLNESLNNIRIVTGQSVDEMAKFAEKANASAKALSTTTTAYTDAALIFYQQGLSGKEVTDRTDTVIKMANVTRESAEEVSSSMTAIWNNFADGSHELEYYADVITALGASTASSSKEIAEGLEKFASIGETVGLSYEYATSALAAVVANTRQSADVVGTAFKTLFARLQGLKLGETLEDGVDLNKYSQALETVGVKVLDVNGELRDANDILKDTAGRWDTLTKAQQTALAQTVAGTRQYSQFIALMESWDDVEKNLQTAQNSEGTLQNQADIYAESWEAAQKRVKAAAQGIYQDLLDDKFFIGLTNGLEKVLEVIHEVINGFGGMKGVLTAIGSIFLTTYAQKMPEALNNLRQNFMVLTGHATKLMTELQEETQEYLNTIKNDNSGTYSLTFKTQAEGMAKVSEMQQRLILNSKNMTEQERQSYQLKIQNVQMMYEEANAIAKEVEELERKAEVEKQNFINKANEQINSTITNYNKAEDKASIYGDKLKEATDNGDTEAVARYTKLLEEAKNAAAEYDAEIEILKKTIPELNSVLNQEASGHIKVKGNIDETLNSFAEYIQKYKQLQSLSATGIGKAKQWQDEAKAIQGDVKKLDNLKTSMKEYIMLVAKQSKESGLGLNKNGEITKLYKELKTLTNDSDLDAFAQKLEKTFGFNTAMSTFEKEIDNIREKIRTIGGEDALTAFDNAVDAAKEKSQQLKDALSNTGQVAGEMPQGVFRASIAWTQFASSAMATYTAINNLKNAFITIGEAVKGNASGMEVFGATVSTLMGIVMAYTSVQALATTLIKKDSIAKQMNVIATVVKTGATYTETAAEAGLTTATWAQVVANIALKTSMSPLLVVTLALVAAMAVLAITIMGIVAAAKAISNAYNADAIAAEKAANAAKGLAEAYDEAKTHCEQMIAAMDDYKSARDALSELTKGTQEYRDALQAANEAGLELINSTDNLKRGEDYEWENGELKISNAAMDRIKDEEEDNVKSAKASSLMADARARQLAVKSNTTNLVRSDDISMGTAIATGGASAGVLAADTSNIIGNLIEESRIKELTDLYREMGEEAFDAATLEKLGFDTANKAYINSVKDVVKETIAAEEGMSNAARMAAEMTMSENENFNHSDEDVQDKVAAVGGKMQEKAYQDAYDKYFEMAKNDDLFGIGSKKNKQAMQAYAQQMGLDQLTGYKVTNYKKGGNVEYQYIDENNEKQTREVTREQIAMQLAATDAAKQLGEQTDVLINTFNKLEASTNKADQALSDFLGGDMEYANKAEFDTMASELGVSAGDKINKNQAGNYLASNIGDKDGKLTNDEAKAMGYESAQAMKEAFVEEFNSTSGAWKDIEIPDNLLSSVADDMSLKTAQSLENTIKELNIGPAGEKAGEDFINGLNSMLKGVNIEDQQAAMGALMDIDWSSWDALKQADAVLQEFGGDIDLTSEEWKKFANEMRIASGATPDFSTLKADLNEISAILNDLDFGKIIKEEDYQRLIAYNKEWERFFILQADGSRQFIGNSQDMQSEIQNNIRQQREELAARKKVQEEFVKANGGREDDTGADWENKSGTDIETAQNLLNASGATEDMLKTLGYSDEIIQDIITKATSGQEDLVEEGTTRLREMYQRIGEFQKENLDEADAQLDEMLASTAKDLDSLLALKDEISEEAFNKQMEGIASTTSSIQELQQLLANGLSAEGYINNLQRLGEEYENCADEVEKYKQALLSGNEEQQIAAQHALESSIKIGEASNEYNLVAEDVETQARQLAKAYNLDADSAGRLAVANQRMNRGVKTLHDNWKDWNKELRASDHTTMDYAATLNDAYDALADLVGAVDTASISEDFLDSTTADGAHHLDLLGKAAEGDVQAINELGVAVGQASVEAMEFNEAFVQSAIAGGQLDSAFDLNAFNNYKAEVLEGITALQEQITNGTIAAGENITSLMDGTGASWVDSLNQMAIATGMSVEQMNALLNELGVQAKVEVKEVPQKMSVPTYTEYSTAIQKNPPEYDEHHNLITPSSWSRTTWTVPGPSKEVDGYVQVAQISTEDGGIKAPQVTYTGTGGSKGGGGVSPSSKKSSGGGKKGGGGKTPEHKHKEKVDKFEADPFHKVNQELEDIEHNLKMINKQQSHMFGKELINNLKQQNAQLKKQTELHKEKLAIAQREADVLRAQLKAQGVAFDGDNIANYNAMLQAAENQINALINQYNALSAAEQEAYDNAYKETKSPIQKAEDYYEELKKQMDKYTDYMSTVYSEEEAIQDALFQQIENNLKAYQVTIEVKLDMSEARRAMNKFLKDMSTDIKNMYKTSAEWATAFKTSEKDAGTYEDDINTKLKQLEDYKNASVGGANDMFATESEKYKAITDLEKEILEDSENLLNEYQTAYDNLRDAFGEVADQFNDILDQFDSINDTLDHYAKVIELLHGGETDNGRKQLAEVYSLQKENSLERQDAMRKWGDELQKRRAEAIANGYDEDDSYIKDIDAQIEENSKNLESEIENYIDTIQRELENSIKMAQSQMDKSIWGASMSDVRQEWDDKKAMADGYYDSVERIYQLESLESKWKAAITNTSSLKAQQQLTAIMDKQVAALESKNALSEKDIELAEKELAVYQAQIALEEAQNNKNSMKLTRDETGNWSYQYVADEDDIADKQQSYLDKINEWRTASINAAEEITERTMDAYENFSERMTEIMNDVTLSEAERDAKIAELNATYWGEDGIITKLVEDSNYIQSTANQSTYIELAGLYEADQANLERMSEAEKTIIENMTAAGVASYKSLRDYVIGDDGKSGMYGEIYDLCKQTNENSSAAWKSMAASAINRMYKDPNSVSKTVKQAYVDMEGALKIYNKAVENSEKASGIEWSKVNAQLDGVQKKIKETGKRVDEFTSKLKALGVFEKAVMRIKETWDKTSGSIKKATSDLEKYYKLLSNGKSTSTSSSSGGSSNAGGGSASSSSGGDGKLTVGETVTYTGGTYYYDSYGTSPAGSRGPGKKVKVTSIKEDGRPYPIHVKSTDSAYGWLTKGQLSGYDTGGYTGDWAGGDGRLALLHSKELVLNKDDTKNILDTVQILRQFAIEDLAQSVGDAISQGLSSLIGKALNFNSNNYDTTQVNNNTNEEQNLTINVEAVFPHADDINEIREAILSLPNYASQFKMRK